MTAQILEAAMLICFGLSWPMNAYKSYKAATAVSTSWQFITLITAGYIAGIAAKFFSGDISWVLVVYFLNLGCLVINWAVYFRNRKLDKNRAEQQKEAITQNTSSSIAKAPHSTSELLDSSIKSILIASDGSEGSCNAVRYATEIINPLCTPSVQVICAAAEQSTTATTKANHALQQAEGILSEAGIKSDSRVLYGDAAEAIVKETDTHAYDLIIMGSRGLSGIKGFVLGSVSRTVCNNVGCPVLIVK